MNDDTYQKIQDVLHWPMLGIDYGKKRVGTSLFNHECDLVPRPFKTLLNKNRKSLIADLSLIINQEKVAIIVVGIPHLLDGQETDMGKIIKRFIYEMKSHLQKEGPLKHYYFFEQDETLSSFEAESRMKSSPLFNFRIDKEKVDCLSACIILEEFISKQTKGY